VLCDTAYSLKRQLRDLLPHGYCLREMQTFVTAVTFYLTENLYSSYYSLLDRLIWLVRRLTSHFSTQLGYIRDKVLSGDLVPLG